MTTINNKIKQSALCCIYCGKSYKTRSNIEKHLILCEINYKSKNNKNNNYDSDEDFSVPSSKKMYQIILELTMKCNKLENKLNELNKFVVKKIKKIDILQYLNNLSDKPILIFDNITDIIHIEDSDIEFLFNNSYLDTMNIILNRCIYEKSNLPISSFNQKNNVIYIFNKNMDNYTSWNIMSRDKFVRFLNIIQFKLSKALSNWRKNNLEKILDNDNISIIYDKTFSKLMTPEFKTETTYNKYYNNIYNKIKKDINTCLMDINFTH